jgi:hypothetical protein
LFWTQHVTIAKKGHSIKQNHGVMGKAARRRPKGAQEKASASHAAEVKQRARSAAPVVKPGRNQWTVLLIAPVPASHAARTVGRSKAFAAVGVAEHKAMSRLTVELSMASQRLEYQI